MNGVFPCTLFSINVGIICRIMKGFFVLLINNVFGSNENTKGNKGANPLDITTNSMDLLGN